MKPQNMSKPCSGESGSHDEGSGNLSMNRSENNFNTSGSRTSNCVLCTKVAVSVCRRCGDYYCSPECQRKDWQSHRYICFPMPALVRPDSTVSSSNEPAIPMPQASTLMYLKDMEQQEILKNILKIPSHKEMANIIPKGNSHAELPQQTVPKALSHDQNLEYNTKVATQIPIPSILKKNSRVLVTGFRSINRCYIRSLAPSDDEGYMRAIKLIDTYGKTAPMLDSLPRPKTYAITHLDQDGIMYRVQVLSMRSASEITVLFVEFGTISWRKLSDLRRISDEIEELPKYAIEVQLQGVANFEINYSLMKLLTEFVDVDYKVDFIKGGKYVSLRFAKDNDCLNRKIKQLATQFYSDNISKNNDSIANTGSTSKEKYNDDTMQQNGDVKHKIPPLNNSLRSYETSKTEAETKLNPEPVMVAPFVSRKISVNAEKIDAFVLDISCLEFGYFSCIMRSDLGNLAKIHKFLENFKDTKEAYKPRLNEYCIGKYQDDWYRAKVTAVLGNNKYNVLYVDYLNECTLSSEDIRPYPIDLKFDCTTNLCLIHGLPTDIDDKLVKYLRHNVESNAGKFIDKVISIDEDILVVKLLGLMENYKNLH